MYAAIRNFVKTKQPRRTQSMFLLMLLPAEAKEGPDAGSERLKAARLRASDLIDLHNMQSRAVV